MTDYAVDIPFIGHDQVSPIIRSMNSSFSSFGRTSNSIFRNMRKDALSVKSIMGGILGASIVNRGIGLAEEGFRNLTEQVIGFDHTMVSAASKFGKEGFGRHTKEFRDVSLAARQATLDTGFVATDAAGAMHDFAQAGISASDAIKLIKPAAILAKAGDVQLAEGAKYASTSLAVFQKKAEDFTKIGDILTWTANASKMSFAELYETMKMGGKAIDVSTKDISKKNDFMDVATFSAIARAMGDAGIVGEQAGTHMKTGFIRMISGGKMADAEIKKLGFSATDKNGQLIDLLDLIGILESKYKKMNTGQQVASMRKIFGLEALPGMLTVMSAGSEKLKEFRKEALEAGGYTNRVFAKMSDSYETKLNRIRALLVETGFKVIDQYGDQIPSFLDSIIQKVSQLDASKIGLTIREIKDDIVSVYDTVKSLYPIIKASAVIWAAFKIRGAISTIGDTVRDVNNRRLLYNQGINPFSVSYRSFDKLNGIPSSGFSPAMSAMAIKGGLTKGLDGLNKSSSDASIGVDKAYRALGRLDQLFAVGGLAAGVYTLIDAMTATDIKISEKQNKTFRSNMQDLMSNKGESSLELIAKKRKDLMYRMEAGVQSINNIGSRLNLGSDLLGALMYGDIEKSTLFSTIKGTIGYASKYQSLTPKAQQAFLTEASDVMSGRLSWNYKDPYSILPMTYSDTPTSGGKRERKYSIDSQYGQYTEGGMSNYNDYILSAIGRLEQVFSNNKLQVEATVNLTGNIPDGTTATVKTKTDKAPNIDKGKLGKN